MKYKLLLMMLALMVSVQSWGLEFIEEGIKYSTKGSTTVAVTSIPEKYAGDVVIPATVKHGEITYNVVEIGQAAFADCFDLTSVVIPEGVTSIGEYLFQESKSLVSVTLPESLKTIGFSMFSFCSSLTSVNIPKGVTEIGEYAFRFCSALTSITIPEGVTSIEKAAFYGCSSLASLNIPASVTRIGEQVFFNCGNLALITVDAGNANYISEDGVLFSKDMTALYKCSTQKSGEYTVPSSVTSIATYAFYGCTNLTAINVDVNNANYCSVDGVLFSRDMSTLYQYPVKKDGEYTVPSEVVNIELFAFYGCSGLTVVNIPAGVKNIGPRLFYDCTSLTAINIDEGNAKYRSIDGVLFDKNWAGMYSLYRFPPKKSGEYTIPDGVERIHDYAFSGCSSLTSLTIPEHVTDIWEYIFEGCSSLTYLDVKKFTEYIDDYFVDYLTRGANPNCLVYLPSTVDPSDKEDIDALGVNVIYGDVAPRITLTDGADFYCPAPFTADAISYTRTPKVYASTLFNGWQTIVLPFEVTDYETKTGGEIKPIKTSGTGHFWLREQSASDNTTLYFTSTANGIMEANKPYIISFPGDAFDASLQGEGAVTFSASNKMVHKSVDLSKEKGGFFFTGVYQNQTIDGWILKTEMASNGGAFEQVTGATVAPFYAYISEDINNPIPGFTAPQQLLISNKLPTALDELEEASATLQVLTTPEGIVIIASAPGKAAIKNAMGIVVSYLTLEAGSNPVSHLPTGVYFIEGQKFFVQ